MSEKQLNPSPQTGHANPAKQTKLLTPQPVLSPAYLVQRALQAPGTLHPQDILQLQRTMGNQAVGQLLQRMHQRPPTIQAKQTVVGPPNDRFEQEADRVAEQVTSMPALASPAQRAPLEEELQTKPIDPIQRDHLEEEDIAQTKPIDTIQRLDEDDEDEMAQPKRDAHPLASALDRLGEVISGAPSAEVQRDAAGDGSFAVDSGFQSQLDGSKGGGSPLPSGLRSNLEPKFGADFSQVRVHTGGQAAAMNQQIQAKAFTHGNDIYFGGGHYHPGTKTGQQLIAHELTHTIQQTGGQTAQRAPLIQRRLMSFATFAARKRAYTEKKGVWIFKFERSLTDVQNIYTAYDNAVKTSSWDKANEELDNLQTKVTHMRTKTYWKSDTDRDTFLNEVEQGIREEKDWVDQQKYPRWSGSDEVQDTRPVIALYMEQGVAGHLGQMILASQQFSTCSPMVMFNRNTKVGGLYHLPGGASQQYKKSNLPFETKPELNESYAPSMEDLKAMCKYIQPTDIIVYLGAGVDEQTATAMYGGNTTFDEDQQPMMTYFQKLCPTCNIQAGEETGSIAITLSRSGGLSVASSAGFEEAGGGTYDLHPKNNKGLPSTAKLFGKSEVADFWIAYV
jgi:hypothetical protein